jgi:hypothetical protein
MIHHQNADAMVPASARLRGIPPPDVRHFEYYQGGVNASQTRTDWDHGVSILMMNYGYAKIIGKS